jgi:predicted nucleotidyltransferase
MEKHKLDSFSEIENRLRLRDLKKGTIRDDDLKMLYSFAEKATKEFGGMIHGIILFGSISRGNKGTDMDVLVLVDDVSLPVTREVIGAYRLGMGQVLAELNAVERVHLTTIGLSDFWDGVRQSDPIIVNIIRDGKAIIDTGFFKPLKKLLDLGRIRPSKEAIEAHINKAKALLNSVDIYMRASLDNLYWATMDAAHAVIMASGITPPSAKDIPSTFSKVNGITKADAAFVKRMYQTMKAMAKSKTMVDPIKIKKLKIETEKFVKKMEKKVF